MRRIGIIAAALAFLPRLSSAQASAPPGPRDVVEGQTTITLPDTQRYTAAEREVVRLERRRSAAIAAHDTAWLATVYAREFRGVVANGRRVDRSALFGVFMLDNPTARFTIDELDVRTIAPDAMTVTGRLRTLGPDGRLAGESRYIHVYGRRAGRWRILVAQGTAVPPA